ncbi:MAG: hypothetical protein JSR82_05785 [Verrucomicrobia bacterium]|nr:hypothetical protein [Verrucomicrobiota bacterium]
MPTADPPQLHDHGQKFAHARQRLGLTREKLMELALVSVGSLRSAERGIRINPATHRTIVDALKAEAARQGKNVAEFCIEYPPEFMRGYSPADAPATRAPEASLQSPPPPNNAHRAALAAANAFLRHGAEARLLRIGRVETEQQLRQLYLIDDDAYGAASIPFELFRDLWVAFPAGLVALFREDRIIGAIGIWPLEMAWHARFKACQLKEVELDPASMEGYQQKPSKLWYISGVVLSPSASSRAIKMLLEDGVRAWRRNVKLAFPCEFIALASSDEGLLMLEGFGFYRLQNGAKMPDGFPLYELTFDSEADLIDAMRKRSLLID